MLTFILCLVVVIGVFAYAVSKQPDVFTISRSANMTATPAAIFPQIDTLRNWNGWSPWAKMDPNCQTTFEGPESGIGSIMRWDGNNKVGKGSMTIIANRPNEIVELRLDFLKPMVATNTATFTLTPQGNQTLVTWKMTGTNSLIGKFFGLVLNCEKMIAGNFDQGLAGIKSIVERQ